MKPWWGKAHGSKHKQIFTSSLGKHWPKNNAWIIWTRCFACWPHSDSVLLKKHVRKTEGSSDFLRLLRLTYSICKRDCSLMCCPSNQGSTNQFKIRKKLAPRIVFSPIAKDFQTGFYRLFCLTGVAHLICVMGPWCGTVNLKWHEGAGEFLGSDVFCEASVSRCWVELNHKKNLDQNPAD